MVLLVEDREERGERQTEHAVLQAMFWLHMFTILQGGAPKKYFLSPFVLSVFLQDSADAIYSPSLKYYRSGLQ